MTKEKMSGCRKIELRSGSPGKIRTSNISVKIPLEILVSPVLADSSRRPQNISPLSFRAEWGFILGKYVCKSTCLDPGSFDEFSSDCSSPVKLANLLKRLLT
jgi:hypothetical protein